jgi:hypothetical protein
MKKLIGALALAAMVATSAFAEISFGGWVRTLPTYVGSDGEDIKTAALSASWGGPFWARWDASWTSDDGKAGLKFKLAADKGGVGTHDDVGIWLKPIDQLKIEIGSLDNFGGLRSDLGFGSWNWLRPSTILVEDEGITFGRGENGQGLGLLITPMDALKIAVVTPLANTLQRGDIGFGKASVAAGYTIDGLGTIKAGFFGEYNAAGDASKYGRIEGAFDLTGIDKLFLTVGVAYRLASSDYWKGVHANDKKKADGTDLDLTTAEGIAAFKNNVWASTTGNYMLKAALAASYGITEAFKVSANFAMYMFNKDVADDPAMQFGVGADYALSDALNITGDVRMLMPNNDVDPSLSFLVGLVGSIGSNASLGIGFQGITGFGDKARAGNLKVVEATEGKKFAWAVPLKAELSF